jgi:hypothetical protein
VELVLDHIRREIWVVNRYARNRDRVLISRESQFFSGREGDLPGNRVELHRGSTILEIARVNWAWSCALYVACVGDWAARWFHGRGIDVDFDQVGSVVVVEVSVIRLL